MNSLHRLLRVFDVFEDGAGVYTAEQLIAELGYTRSTMYRYLKTLVDAGMLTSWHGNGYTLGPRIIEFGALINKRDPLLLASRSAMQQIGKSVPSMVMLTRRYRERCLCVYHETGLPDFQLKTDLSRSRALTADAPARVMLSYFSPTQLRKFYDRNGDSFSTAGLGGSLGEVRTRLRSIRDAGFDIDLAENDDDATSIAAPVIDRHGQAIASVALAVPKMSAPPESVAGLARHVIDASQNICRAIA